MIHSIDYYSFTIQLPDVQDGNRVLAAIAARKAAEVLEFMPPLEFGKGIRAGLLATARPMAGVTCSIGKGWLLVEISGVGCQTLEGAGLLLEVIKKTASRATRIDICTDILTDTLPAEFAELRDEGRTKTLAKIDSEDGHTFYLGSRSSNRHTKIYRYNKPHPRHEFLRIEYTYRQEDAKKVAAEIEDGASVDELALASAARYGWLHPCWQPSKNNNGKTLEAFRKAREKGKTVYWLHSQVIPAIKKLIDEGLITLEDVVKAIEA